MRFIETALKDAYIIELDKFGDERGFFARSYCEYEFKNNGLNTKFVQSNISYNKKKGTIRGMHRQLEPYGEIKLVRCVRGAIFDVIIDLRNNSDTFTKWISVELTQENRKTLYIPEGFAHGFLTLEDDVEIYYQHSQYYTPHAEASVRWNDPTFNIKWRDTDNLIVSDKDQSWPDFSD